MEEFPYTRLIAALYAGFACVFFFLNRQHPTKFARYLGWSLLIEALRVLIRLHVSELPVLRFYDWFAVNEGLQAVGNCILFLGCADLAAVSLPRSLPLWYVGPSLVLVAVNRYAMPHVLMAALGITEARGQYLGVFINQIVLFVPVAISRVAIMYWLFRIWKDTRMPAALVTLVFCAMFAVSALAFPFQYFYDYNPSWASVIWFVRVLGFCGGLLLLLMNQQLYELRASERRLAAAQASAKLGSWEFDLKTGRRIWSDQLYKVFGREPAAGLPVDEEVVSMVTREDREAFRHYYMPPLGGGTATKHEFRIERPDATRAWIETRSEVVADPQGRPRRLIGTAQDISEKKDVEEQLLRAQRVENLGMLAAGIAHDFNNVLTPMLMVGPMLREELADNSSKDLLMTVEASARRGQALVRQILNFANGADTARVLLQPESVVRELGSLITKTFPQSIRLEQKVAGTPWKLSANPTKLHQVLLNLCINARDAMPEGGTLTLSYENRLVGPGASQALPVGRPGRFGVFEVRDTGVGIAPEDLQRIWEPFFTTKRATHGTGLGLSTVRGIVVGYDGFCDVSSQPGVGTTFTVCLPAAEEPGS